MDSTKKKRITGFYLRPKFERLRGKEVLKGVEVELLENGDTIEKKYRICESQQHLERLQRYLLSTTMINLGLKESMEQAIIAANLIKKINAVNMFKIEPVKENNDGSQSITVIFLRNGYFFMQSTFEAVSKEKLEKIREMLIDNTKYNLECDMRCRTVTVLDLIAVIDNML